MRKNWSFSLVLLACYIGVFVFWKNIPSRTAFLCVGLFVVGGLAAYMYRQFNKNYFVDRVDACLHSYVLIDLFLEAVSFEGLRLFQPHALVHQFHNNNNYVVCTLTLASLVGGYRFFRLYCVSNVPASEWRGPCQATAVNDCEFPETLNT